MNCEPPPYDGVAFECCRKWIPDDEALVCCNQPIAYPYVEPEQKEKAGERNALTTELSVMEGRDGLRPLQPTTEGGNHDG